MLTVFTVGFCNDYLVSCDKVLGKNTLSHWTYTMSSLSFSWSVEPKRPRPVNDHARDGRRETGGHSTLARACTPLAKSEEKERLFAVFSSFICGIKLVYTFLFSEYNDRVPWVQAILKLQLLGNENWAAAPVRQKFKMAEELPVLNTFTRMFFFIEENKTKGAKIS